MKTNGSSAREGLLSLAVGAVALIVSLTVAIVRGYGRPADDVAFVLGIPDWIFWGVLLPWAAATVFTGWFALRYMKDEDLGAERDEEGP